MFSSKSIDVRKIDKLLKNKMPEQSRKIMAVNASISSEEVNTICNMINSEYSIDIWEKKYDGIENIPQHLMELLKGSGINGLTVENLDVKHLDYLKGKRSNIDFLRDLEALFIGLGNEMAVLEELNLSNDYMKERY